MAKHLRRTPTALRVGRAITVPVVLAGAMALTAPAFAGKPAPSGGGTTTSGATCSASPNPVAYNTDYTLTVSRLAAYDIVNVLVQDSVGTRTWNLQADGAGTISVVGHAYTMGNSNVTVQKKRNHGFSTVTTCSFSVV
jgi:hypothetical protein